MYLLHLIDHLLLQFVALVPKVLAFEASGVEEDEAEDPLVADPTLFVLSREHLPLAWASRHLALVTIESCHDAVPVISLHANDCLLFLSAFSFVYLSQLHRILEHSMVGHWVCILNSLLVDVQIQRSRKLKVTFLTPDTIEDVTLGYVV